VIDHEQSGVDETAATQRDSRHTGTAQPHMMP
jgi:hypothetical protein